MLFVFTHTLYVYDSRRITDEGLLKVIQLDSRCFVGTVDCITEHDLKPFPIIVPPVEGGDGARKRLLDDQWLMVRRWLHLLRRRWCGLSLEKRLQHDLRATF